MNETISHYSSSDSNINNQTSYSTTTTKSGPFWSLEYTILAVMVTSLAVVGVIGNVSVLIVYSRRRDNLASNTFIKVLAFIDLLVCSFVMSYSIVYELHLVSSDIACRFCEFLSHFCVSASNITLVAIATERYIAVCQIGTKLNINNINVGVWIIFVLSVIVGAPAIGTFAVVRDSEVRDIECQFPHEYSSGKFCHFTYTVMGKPLVKAYQTLTMLFFFITVVIIVILYSVIYYVLWKKSRLRQLMINQASTNNLGILDNETSTNELGSYTEEHCTKQWRQRKPTRKGNYSVKYQQESQFLKSNDMDSNCQSNGTSVDNSLAMDNHMEQSEIDIEIQNSQENAKEVQNNLNVPNNRKIRRKIKFSVSAQTGRSEKIKRKKYYHKRTAKMLFLCSVIYILTWLPFWIDVFGLTNSLILRYLFFIGNATNPIVYGIVNERVRSAFKRLFFDCIGKCFRIADPLNREDAFNLSSSSVRCTTMR